MAQATPLPKYYTRPPSNRSKPAGFPYLTPQKNNHSLTKKFKINPALMSPAAGIGTVSPRRTVTGVWCQSAPV